MENERDLPVIGRNTRVDFGRRAVDVPAKIDTGADSSSIWATKIRVGKDGVLRFALFGEGSPYYNGKIFKRSDFRAAMVRSASGHEQIRYRTHLTVTIAGKKIRALFNLSDRSNNNFPVLIGRRTLAKKFLVDVDAGEIRQARKLFADRPLTDKLREDPYKFHQEYIEKRKGQS